jgi:hypothetical protein
MSRPSKRISLFYVNVCRDLQNGYHYFIVNVIMYLTSLWPIIFIISQFLHTDNITRWEQRENGQINNERNHTLKESVELFLNLVLKVLHDQ